MTENRIPMPQETRELRPGARVALYDDAPGCTLEPHTATLVEPLPNMHPRPMPYTGWAWWEVEHQGERFARLVHPEHVFGAETGEPPAQAVARVLLDYCRWAEKNEGERARVSRAVDASSVEHAATMATIALRHELRRLVWRDARAHIEPLEKQVPLTYGVLSLGVLQLLSDALETGSGPRDREPSFADALHAAAQCEVAWMIDGAYQSLRANLPLVML